MSINFEQYYRGIVPLSIDRNNFQIKLNYNATLTTTTGQLGINLANANTWTAEQTFNAGITGSGNTGSLTAGSGILGTANTWTAGQTFKNIETPETIDIASGNIGTGYNLAPTTNTTAATNYPLGFWAFDMYGVSGYPSVYGYLLSMASEENRNSMAQLYFSWTGYGTQSGSAGEDAYLFARTNRDANNQFGNWQQVLLLQQNGDLVLGSYNSVSYGTGNIYTSGLGAFNGGIEIGGSYPYYLTVNNTTPSTGGIRFDGNNIVLEGNNAGAVYLSFDKGTGGVNFGNGSGNTVASVNSSGLGTFNGGIDVSHNSYLNGSSLDTANLGFFGYANSGNVLGASVSFISIWGNVDPVGAFIGENYDSVQIGMYNRTTTTQGVLGGNKWSPFLEITYNGEVYTSANVNFDIGTTNSVNGSVRNIIDNGSGESTWSGLATFNGGITGSGNTGSLTAGSGILGTANTWTAEQSINGIISNPNRTNNIVEIALFGNDGGQLNSTLPPTTTLSGAYGFGQDSSGTLWTLAPIYFKWVAIQESTDVLFEINGSSKAITTYNNTVDNGSGESTWSGLATFNSGINVNGNISASGWVSAGSATGADSPVMFSGITAVNGSNDASGLSFHGRPRIGDWGEWLTIGEPNGTNNGAIIQINGIANTVGFGVSTGLTNTPTIHTSINTANGNLSVGGKLTSYSGMGSQGWGLAQVIFTSSAVGYTGAGNFQIFSQSESTDFAYRINIFMFLNSLSGNPSIPAFTVGTTDPSGHGSTRTVLDGNTVGDGSWDTFTGTMWCEGGQNIVVNMTGGSGTYNFDYIVIVERLA